MALAFIEDDELLDRLRRAFPECFSSKRPKELRVPASILRQRAWEASCEEEGSPGYANARAWDQEFSWYNLDFLAEIGIPRGPWFSDNGGEPSLQMFVSNWWGRPRDLE